jgi:hypothetical protein
MTSDRNSGEVWAHFGIEPVLVHTQIGRRISQADESRQYLAARGDWGCFMVVTLMVLTAHVFPSLFAIHSFQPTLFRQRACATTLRGDWGVRIVGGPIMSHGALSAPRLSKTTSRPLSDPMFNNGWSRYIRVGTGMSTMKTRARLEGPSGQYTQCKRAHCRGWLARIDKDTKAKRNKRIFAAWMACHTLEEIGEQEGIHKDTVSETCREMVN